MTLQSRFFEILKAEVTTDPLARGYAGMTDTELTADLNTAYRTRTREFVTRQELWDAIVLSDVAALNANNTASFWNFMHMLPEENVSTGGNNRVFLIALFGNPSPTYTALVALAITSISRANELSLPHVKIGHVRKARR